MPMSYEHKPNCGTLFQRDNGGNDKAPTDTGDAMLVCPHCTKPFWSKLAGWFKQAADTTKSNRIGLRFESFKTRQELESAKQPKSDKQTQPRPSSAPQKGFNSPNVEPTDVPF